MAHPFPAAKPSYNRWELWFVGAMAFVATHCSQVAGRHHFQSSGVLVEARLRSNGGKAKSHPYRNPSATI